MNAEDELLQLYRIHFGYGNRAMRVLEDSHNFTTEQNGSYIVDLEAAQAAKMAPRVCEVLRASKTPHNVRASHSDDKVTVSWDAPSNTDALSGYSLFRSTESATEGTSLTATASNVLRYVDTGAARGRTYFYRVKALNGTDRSYTTAPVRVIMPPHPNGPDVSSASAFTAAEGTTAVATLTATDSDTQTADLAWSIPPGNDGGPDRSKFSLTSAGQLWFRGAKDFENPDDAGNNGVYDLTVRVSDGEHTDTVDITVALSNVNEIPSADAGPDQEDVAEGAIVTLSGVGTDPDGDEVLTYGWMQTGGTPNVTLSDTAVASPTFTAPTGLTADTTLTFMLRVADDEGSFDDDEVSITVVKPGAEESGLTAQFNEMPSSHDGSTFSFRLKFSKDVAISYQDFTGSVFEVTGGTVQGARRLVRDSNTNWEIRLRPSGGDNVEITLAGNRTCWR